MTNQVMRIVACGAALAAAIFAQNNQNNQRQANIVGGGGPDRGKCTVEVVVDDVAQVELRGGSASLRTLSGQPAQWRRFECTSPMPANAASYRFAGVDGRGRQEMIRDPRNGGAAVIQIEDKDGGAEGYTFDIFWEMRGPAPSGPPPEVRGEVRPDYRPDYRQDSRPDYRDGDYYRRYHHSFSVDEAVRVCQQSILAQATRRFRTQDIHFDRTAIDDNPGREDWVKGTLDVHRGPRGDRFGFACSVDFSSGRVRTADLDVRPLPDRDDRHQ